MDDWVSCFLVESLEEQEEKKKTNKQTNKMRL
jgi:hypothetical protein